MSHNSNPYSENLTSHEPGSIRNAKYFIRLTKFITEDKITTFAQRNKLDS